jgi:hypothetical protein
MSGLFIDMAKIGLLPRNVVVRAAASATGKMGLAS